MLSEKKIISFILLIWIVISELEAQPDFNTEISCDDGFTFDSALFFRPVFTEDLLVEDNQKNADLFGPYFNEYPQIRSDIISALSYYPELANVHLRFSYRPIKQTMNSRPSPVNIFRKKENRRYIIIVNNNKGKVRGLPFEKLSFNIKIGWLGHELAHTCEYESMTNWKTILFSVKYIFSKKFVRMVERYTDSLTIKHGLAYPLYDGTDYLFKSNEIDDKYRNYALANYLSLSEILCIWCKCTIENGLISKDN